MGKLVVVVGGQYGSEAKGAVVAHLTRTEDTPPVVTRVGGPNAGHTVYDDNSKRWPLRQVPAGVIRADATLVIGAGSVVDPFVLQSEIDQLELAGHMVAQRLFVDRNATVLKQQHLQHEQNSGITDRIGSTGKGIGIARAERIMRTVDIVRDSLQWSQQDLGSVRACDQIMTDWLHSGGTVIVEGTQGYALGLHRQFYPYATSADCTAIDVLAQAQVSPWSTAVTEFEIWVVFRTYPIRVAGHSGPLHHEISWDKLAERTQGYIGPEKTTVTQKVRRVGEWDVFLAREALRANGGAQSPAVHAALMMVDYLDPALAGVTENSDEIAAAVYMHEQGLGIKCELLGTGPQSIVDRRERT